ncbi:MAG TPA: TetR family transcriptional regulator [Pseudorhodoferax sp.]|nr:TetR family transcriptional regulator [Pseudorhodoferax sp.]
MTEFSPRRRNREETRERLQQALLRVKSSGRKLSIYAVAVEAGVHASLIHNTYPDMAERIRAEVGRGTRQQLDATAAALIAAKEQQTALHAELKAARADIAKLASINETLRQEVTLLRAASAGKVVLLGPPGSR